jgi:hypothetical protein
MPKTRNGTPEPERFDKTRNGTYLKHGIRPFFLQKINIHKIRNGSNRKIKQKIKGGTEFS